VVFARAGFGEAGTPLEQEEKKDPLIKREPWNVRAPLYQDFAKPRRRKAHLEMVKAVGAPAMTAVLGGPRKGLADLWSQRSIHGGGLKRGP